LNEQMFYIISGFDLISIKPADLGVANCVG